MATARNARPVIGINSDYLSATKTAAAQAKLAIGYADSVFDAGGLPIIIPPMSKDGDPDAWLDQLDGIVLTGGLDLDPKRQGLGVHPSVRTMAARREDSDRKFMSRIIERQMPLLAIGSSMQLLNLMFGGTVYAHLPEEHPRAMPHYDPSGAAHRHIVVLEPDTRLDEIYGGGELRVNSAHHQGVRTLGKGLVIGAKSPADELIEAIEVDDESWFCVGVQWHPEADTASALDQQLFECFVQSAVRVAQPLRIAA